MGLARRKKELKKLILYAKEHKFNPELVQKYESELINVEEKLNEQYSERERFKKINEVNNDN